MRLGGWRFVPYRFTSPSLLAAGAQERTDQLMRDARRRVRVGYRAARRAGMKRREARDLVIAAMHLTTSGQREMRDVKSDGSIEWVLV